MDIEYSAYSEDGKFISVPKMEDLCRMLTTKFEREEDTIKYLQEENEHLKSEHYKDETIKEYKEKYETMKENYYRGFPISKEEEDEIKNWIDKHIKEKHDGKYYSGAIGGRFRYIFHPTTIGVLGEVECTCGESFCFQKF